MPTKTSNGPTDAQILSRLARRKTPATAKQLGTTSIRLRSLEGVVAAGTVSTGKPGRPALLFTVAQQGVTEE